MTNERGQALIEWMVLFPLYVAWIVAAVTFGQWFLIHQELQQAAREAAWLYSSGRMEKTDVRHYVQQSLQYSFPPIQLPDENIELGRCNVQKSFQLDQIRIVYIPPPNSWLRIFFTNPLNKTCVLEETCVIKHAPAYWTFMLIQSGPPVRW